MMFDAHDMMKCLRWWILMICFNLLASPIALADAVHEVFFIDAADVDSEVRQDTLGVVSLNFAIDYQSGTPEIPHLPSYTRHAESFVADGTVAVADCVVISEVPWDSFRILRFPVVEV
jgi:hypothetical protein